MVKALYSDVRNRLESAGIEYASFEADVIFEEVFSKSFKLDMLMGRLERKATDSERIQLEAMLKRRCEGEPLQYIIGRWEFYGIELFVGKGVLIPRQDTETLVDIALGLADNMGKHIDIVDLCSGSGCIAIAMAEQLLSREKKCSVTAAELYDEAYSFLEKNIALYPELGVAAKKLDVLSPDAARSFTNVDIITCNPPYLDNEDMTGLQAEVSFEPKTALYGSEDGLYYYRRISRIWKDSLADGGYIVFEIGCTQCEAVESILLSEGYCDVTQILDNCGHHRVVFGKKYP